MTTAEIVKQANKVVEGLIAERTPPIFESCRTAFAELRELVAYAAKADDGISTMFAEGINSVIKRLDPFRAPVAKTVTSPKEVDEAGFATYVKEQVEKAVAEEPAPALQRLYALQRVLAKASFEGKTTAPIEAFVDPWQQASAQADEDGKKITSGTAGKEEVAIPSVGDIFKAMVSTVEKAAIERIEIDTGWSRDLTSKEFLQGERLVDFGRDGSK